MATDCSNETFYTDLPLHWNEFAWPDWVPVYVRTSIEGFWSESMGRSPKKWGEDAIRNGAPDPEKIVEIEGHKGRYIHCWNNMGRIIKDDGTATVVALPPYRCDVPVLGARDWITEGARRFGGNRDHWQFVCPSCGNVQSLASVMEHNPELDAEQVARWICSECEGRHTPEHGCDWTLCGLFQIHKLQVLHVTGAVYPVFEFANEAESEIPAEQA